MLCPHCGIAAKFEFELFECYPSQDFEVSKAGYELTSTACPACDGYVVLLRLGECIRQRVDYGTSLEMVKVINERILFPLNFVRQVPTEVPDIYKAEFIEACAVISISPKASAALSRRLLQKILREHFKLKKSDLSREIDEFIQTQNAPSYLNDDIDAIRNIGNFAAHPLKSTSTGEIVDVELGEAEWLIEVIESLFDFAFVQPKKQEERRKRLNDKLHDLGKLPLKKK